MSIPVWVFLALVPPILWATVNILDQTILMRFQLSPWTYLALGGGVGVLSAFLVGVTDNGVLQAPSSVIGASLFSGLTLALFSILYFFALSRTDVRIVAILVQMTPIFSLVWGLTLLGENYTLQSYIGMILILLGGILATLSEKGQLNQRFPRGTFSAGLLMLAGACALSVTYLAQEVAVRQSSTLVVFFWQRIGLVGPAIVVLAMQWTHFRKLTPVPIILTSLVEGINLLAILALTQAFALGPFATISFISSLQSLWVLIFVPLVGLFSSTLLAHHSPSISRLVTAWLLVISGLFAILNPF